MPCAPPCRVSKAEESPSLGASVRMFRIRPPSSAVQTIAKAEAESCSTNLSDCFPVTGLAPRRHVKGELQRPCQQDCHLIPRPMLMTQTVCGTLLEKRLKLLRLPCRWGGRESKSYRGVKPNSATKLQSTRLVATRFHRTNRLKFSGGCGELHPALGAARCRRHT